MFFLGLLAGVGAYFIALVLWNWTEKLWPSALALLGVTGGMFAIHYSVGLGAITGIIVLFVVGLIIGKKRESAQRSTPKTPQRKRSTYISHCWNCGKEIDSRLNRLCPRCGEHYICDNCGKCWCDDPRNNHKHVNGGESDMGLFKSTAEKKKEFYFNFRMAKTLFEYASQGKIEMDRNILDVKYKYVDAIKAAKDFTKPGAMSVVSVEGMLEGLERFYNSIKYSFGRYTFNKDYLDGLIWRMDNFLKLGFDSDFLETMELEAWFLSVLKTMH